ncbi:hypothetical protein Dalk_4527 [Desulfatibacillum aliphaticivorans]|uniref:Uncharacterized protein n=1 Tax=Desulfatibacillum aliphaticivorans TaxID=218208 RepID=B8FCP2_DESAL|nr:hypothetical protein [Desulfatibacillum aliphaticivorans]ACL06205.1 hypothetical protein Dalk_4527 [Desulfatibacillum aliphaticivorans]
MKRLFFVLCILLAVASFAQAKEQVENLRWFQLPNSDHAVFEGKVSLPWGGKWECTGASGNDGLAGLYITSSQAGERALAFQDIPDAQLVRMDQNIESELTNYHWHLLNDLKQIRAQASKDSETKAPAVIADLLTDDSWMADFPSRCPWGYNNSMLCDLSEGPYFFIDKDMALAEIESSQEKKEADRIYACELQPALDDGKFWVLRQNGLVERIPADRAFLDEHGLSLKPLKPKSFSRNQDFFVYCHATSSKVKAFDFALENSRTGRKTTFSWKPSAASPPDIGAMPDFHDARVNAWMEYVNYGSDLAASWILAQECQDVKARYQDRDAEDQEMEGGLGFFTERSFSRDLSAFSILGGRAALEETLQLHALTQFKEDGERTVNIASLPGVQVKSHPFHEMLGGKKGEELGLADCVPPDRFFVYAGAPGAVAAFLEDGALFLSRLGGSFRTNSIRYDLTDKYLARLGMDGPWTKKFLKSGAIGETVLFFPDLFFMDGTDITAIARVDSPAIVKSLLALIGVRGLGADSVIEIGASGGQSAWWAMRGDLLFVSSNRGELEKALMLHKYRGNGSLGRSDEFRYMLTQLPLNKETRIYAYLSDPFIRRMVGPEVKIGQLRRIRAKAAMEHLSACALLARLDGAASPDSIEGLIKAGYLQENYKMEGFRLAGDYSASSDDYGPMGALKTLLQAPVSKASKSEAQAYEQYMEAYEYYWRQYFDPVALRIDDKPDGVLEASVFILPLVENTIYDSLREHLTTATDGRPLNTPVLKNNPVAMLSLNLKTEAMGSLSSLTGAMSRYSVVSPGIYKDLTGAVHLALHDASPVISLGSGDLLSMSGGGTSMMGGEFALVLSTVLPMLTRPCTVYLETSDSQRTLQYLRESVGNQRLRMSNFRDIQVSEYYKLGGEDRWIAGIDVFGFAKLRFSLEVAEEFLVIKNIPWTNNEAVMDVEKAPLSSAGLMVYPHAAKIQRASLLATASESARNGTFCSLSRLYPLLEAQYASLKDVEEKHARLFGFIPVHPGSGTWIWDGRRLSSSQYGTIGKQKQPSFDSEEAQPGLLEDLDFLSVHMEFEDAGLRTVAQWRLRE